MSEASPGFQAKQESSDVFRLPELLDHAGVATLAASLAARRGAPVVLDASATRFMGGQALQALLAAARAWRNDNIAFQLINATPEFVEQSRLVGADLDLLAQGDLPQ
jgi:chemotaxis protein CheX